MQHAAATPAIANIIPLKPQLIFCAGGLGSGKEGTLIRLGKHGFTKENSVVIRFEDFMQDGAPIGEHRFHHEKMGARRETFLSERARRFGEAVKSHRHILIETHLDHLPQLHEFIHTAREHGYETAMVGSVMAPESRMYASRRCGLTEETAHAMNTQRTFLMQWQQHTLPVDRRALYEAVVSANEKRVHLLVNEDWLPADTPVDNARYRELKAIWGVPQPSLEGALMENPPSYAVQPAAHDGVVKPTLVRTAAMAS